MTDFKPNSCLMFALLSAASFASAACRSAFGSTVGRGRASSAAGPHARTSFLASIFLICAETSCSSWLLDVICFAPILFRLSFMFLKWTNFGTSPPPLVPRYSARLPIDFVPLLPLVILWSILPNQLAECSKDRAKSPDLPISCIQVAWAFNCPCWRIGQIFAHLPIIFDYISPFR